MNLFINQLFSPSPELRFDYIATVVIVMALANRQLNSKARFVAQGTMRRLQGKD